MLILRVDNPEQADASLPIGWAITENTKRQLEEKGVKRPWVLFSIVRNDPEVSIDLGAETHRQLVPLEKLLTYLPFKMSGSHVIYAIIVWITDDAETDEEELLLKNRLLSKSGDMYTYCLYQYRPHNKDGIVQLNELTGRSIPLGYGFNHTHKYFMFDIDASIEVNIGKEFFAKQPPKFLANWVNGGWRNQPKDQCEFRARMIYAFTLKPVLWVFIFLILYLVVRPTIILYRMLHGLKLFMFAQRFDWKPIFHPKKMRVEQMDPPRIGNNFILTKKNGGDRSWFFLFLHPLFVLFATGILAWAIVCREVIASWNWSAILPWAGGIVLFIILMCFLAFKEEQSSKPLSDEQILKRNMKKTKNEERRRMRQTTITEKRRVALEAAVYRLESGHIATQLRELPKNRQTISLRFKGFKARACRPFARN